MGGKLCLAINGGGLAHHISVGRLQNSRLVPEGRPVSGLLVRYIAILRIGDKFGWALRIRGQDIFFNLWKKEQIEA